MVRVRSCSKDQSCYVNADEISIYSPDFDFDKALGRGGGGRGGSDSQHYIRFKCKCSRINCDLKSMVPYCFCMVLSLSLFTAATLGEAQSTRQV